MAIAPDVAKSLADLYAKYQSRPTNVEDFYKQQQALELKNIYSGNTRFYDDAVVGSDSERDAGVGGQIQRSGDIRYWMPEMSQQSDFAPLSYFDYGVDVGDNFNPENVAKWGASTAEGKARMLNPGGTLIPGAENPFGEDLWKYGGPLLTHNDLGLSKRQPADSFMDNFGLMAVMGILTAGLGAGLGAGAGGWGAAEGGAALAAEQGFGLGAGGLFSGVSNPFSGVSNLFSGSGGITGNSVLDSALKRALMGAATSGVTGGNPLTGALTGGIGGAFGGLTNGLSITGNAALDQAILKSLGGAITSGVTGGNPLSGALGGAVGSAGSLLSSGLGSLFNGATGGVSDIFKSLGLVANAGDDTSWGVNQRDFSQSYVPTALSGNQGGSMDFSDSFFPTDTWDSLFQDTGGNNQWGLPDFSVPNSISFPDLPYDFQLPSNITPEQGQTFEDSIKTLFQSAQASGDTNATGMLQKLFQSLFAPSAATNGTASKNLLGGLFGLGGTPLGGGLDLAARLAPGMFALNYANNQPQADLGPTQALLSQAGLLTNPMTSSAVQNFDLNAGRARGDLLSGLERRGVMGSSFGNMDIGNFDTMAGAQRGKLIGDLGMQGINTQRGLTQDLLTGQLQQRQIQNNLFGKAFEILGSAVKPAGLFG